MCQSLIAGQKVKGITDQGGKPSDIQSRQARPEDVPLGDGLAATARASILTRRERIRRAVEGE